MEKNKNETARETASPYKVVPIMVVLTIFLCGQIAWYVWSSYREINENQQRYLRLQELNGTLAYLDEVLTMSARLWAVTGEERWEKRYLEHEPQLAAALEEVQLLVPHIYQSVATQLEAANGQLVEMNHRAFSMARQGRDSGAVVLLFSPEYERQKLSYSTGMQQIAQQLHQEVDSFYAQQRKQAVEMMLVIMGVLVLLLVVWGATLTMVRRYLDERKASEAALAQANRDLLAKEEESKTFLHGVSHDLRSPVTGILGFLSELDFTRDEISRVLLEPPTADSQKRSLALVNEQMAEMIRFIRASAERLNHLLEALLRLSRTGKIETRPVAVDINPIIRRIVDSLQGTIDKAGAKVMAAELPSATGDPTMIEQVFANLIGNALKYLDPNRPGVIEVGHQDEPGNAGIHRYFVKDNGLGIPARAMPKLFQVFQRFHPSVAAGEGVGLTIVRRAVERQGGKVWCESVEGAGSTFFVELPAA